MALDLEWCFYFTCHEHMLYLDLKHTLKNCDVFFAQENGILVVGEIGFKELDWISLSFLIIVGVDSWLILGVSTVAMMGAEAA